jgi:hypothetical protein
MSRTETDRKKWLRRQNSTSIVSPTSQDVISSDRLFVSTYLYAAALAVLLVTGGWAKIPDPVLRVRIFCKIFVAAVTEV